MITRTDGQTVPPTKITQDNYIEVKGKKGVEIKVPAYLVKDISRAGSDSNYAVALERMEQGRYRLAAWHFLKALDAMSQQKWAQEYCNYGAGNALYANDDFKGATGKSGAKYAPPSVYYKKALEANDKSRFLPDILVKLPVCLLEEEKYDEANAALKDAEKRIKDYGDEIFKAFNYREAGKRASAMLALTDARVAEKCAEKGKTQWQDVKDKWLTARTRCFDYPALQGEAVDGLLRTLLAMKDYVTAKSESESIINKYRKEGDAKQLLLLPGAYFVQGRANLQQAEDYDAKSMKIQANEAYANARWSFLNVVAQFFNNDRYVAQAHYWAGVCYDRLKDVEPSDAALKAARHWKLIVDNFPHMKELAQKELDRVAATTAAPAPTPKKESPKLPPAPKTP
ncbi:MAG: hypothetical protein V1899_05980 [Planctomycetota bacterium]